MIGIVLGVLVDVLGDTVENTTSVVKVTSLPFPAPFLPPSFDPDITELPLPSPLPLLSSNHMPSRVSQCSPVHPGKQRQRPDLPWHRPRCKQVPGSHATAHSLVYASFSHGWQTDPVKPSGHRCISQRSPVHPGKQRQAPVPPSQRP